MTISSNINAEKTLQFMVYPNLTEKNDGEEALFKIAEELGIDLNMWDIQRRHHFGKKPRNVDKSKDSNVNSSNVKTKSRPIFVRFVSCKKRN